MYLYLRPNVKIPPNIPDFIFTFDPDSIPNTSPTVPRSNHYLYIGFYIPLYAFQLLHCIISRSGDLWNNYQARRKYYLPYSKRGYNDSISVKGTSGPGTVLHSEQRILQCDVNAKSSRRSIEL